MWKKATSVHLGELAERQEESVKCLKSPLETSFTPNYPSNSTQVSHFVGGGGWFQALHAEKRLVFLLILKHGSFCETRVLYLITHVNLLFHVFRRFPRKKVSYLAKSNSNLKRISSCQKVDAKDSDCFMQPASVLRTRKGVHFSISYTSNI